MDDVDLPCAFLVDASFRLVRRRLLMVLLEIIEESHPRGSCVRFLCEVPIRSTVASTLEHVIAVRTARDSLEEAVAQLQGTDSSSDAHRMALALISDSAVQSKVVLTREQLHAVLLALDAQSTSQPSSLGECWLAFASRRLEQDKLLSDYVGTNEKSKVKLALTTSPLPPAAAACDVPPNPFGTPVTASESMSTKRPAAAATAAELSEDGGYTELPAQRPRLGSAPTAEPHEASPSKLQQSPLEKGVSLLAFWKAREPGGRPPKSDENAPAAGTDENAPILSTSQAAALTSDNAVRQALREPRLQELLRHIDSAGTREAALQRLELALEDPEFEAFSLQALQTIGWTPSGAQHAE